MLVSHIVPALGFGLRQCALLGQQGVPGSAQVFSAHLPKDHWFLSLEDGMRNQNLGLGVLIATGMSLTECNLFFTHFVCF